ncbi:hypothetical protein AYI70_g11177 [Smittium culicis]|uniref:Uncharacterized protein n=1 Tax=Smittium culicis TaxID=133412 RepID=A0A1R1X322_9FUNG|nr:hypothetical protein AYI70_g11177 [Smittium culicis]
MAFSYSLIRDSYISLRIRLLLLDTLPPHFLLSYPFSIPNTWYSLTITFVNIDYSHTPLPSLPIINHSECMLLKG